MAKIKTAHKAAVISTELTIKEIKRLEAIYPDALEIRNADNETIFAVGTGSIESVSKFGICFADDSRISVLANSKNALTKEDVEEAFGSILLQLSLVEEQAREALGTLEEDLDSLIEIGK